MVCTNERHEYEGGAWTERGRRSEELLCSAAVVVVVVVLHIPNCHTNHGQHAKHYIHIMTAPQHNTTQHNTTP
jgi:hypothetical protein